MKKTINDLKVSDTNYVFFGEHRKKRKSESSYVCPERAGFKYKPKNADKYYGKPYSWVYRNLNRYGNTCIAVSNYPKLSKTMLGEHTIRLLTKKSHDGIKSLAYKTEKDVYIIERIKK